jgi:O-antigen/teichoic acid export membrane protein
MRARGISHWVPLLGRFITGQGTIVAINLVTGFLILRALSISEYAIYVLVSLLQTIGSMGTDLGMSQAVVTLGAPMREDKRSFSSLVASAIRLRKRLFLAVAPVVLVIAYAILPVEARGAVVGIVAVLLALAIAWVQQSGSLATAILNANHDSSGLFRAGVSAAVIRLALVSLVCSSMPYAVSAIAINFAGAAVNTALLWSRSKHFLEDGEVVARQYTDRLVGFMKPLFPGILYYLVQGQVAIVLLAWAGATVAVAEVGALGRLGQVIGVLAMLNGFFIQPYFACLLDRRQFARRAAQLGLILAVGCVLVTLSSIVAPSAWLLVLGPQYRGLADQLVIALLGAQLSVIGATLYTVVIATGRTVGQWLQIPLGIGAQLLFLANIGVKGTEDALLLNLLPAATYAALQCGLLLHKLATWERDDGTS